MSAPAIAVVGLSDAGKSTWLGALCDTMETHIESRPVRIEMDGVPALFHELRGLRDALNVGNYPPHTAIVHHADLQYPLRCTNAKGIERFVLDVSDYSGERISRLYRRADSHVWDDGWKERAGRTRLAVLLRADDIRRLSRRGLEPAAPRKGLAHVIPTEHQPDISEAERHPPTALALIEALQAMRAWRRVGMGAQLEVGAERVAILLTAWDKISVETRNRGPSAFLDQGAPLLAAWLRSNFRAKDLRVYGLSATGGDLSDQTHAKRVREVGVAAAGYVEHGDPMQRIHDVSVPLEWLLFGKHLSDP